MVGLIRGRNFWEPREEGAKRTKKDPFASLRFSFQMMKGNSARVAALAICQYSSSSGLESIAAALNARRSGLAGDMQS